MGVMEGKVALVTGAVMAVQVASFVLQYRIVRHDLNARLENLVLADMAGFAVLIDEALQRRNPYYRDLITGKVLRPLVVRSLPRGAFTRWMRTRGMNDAQSKVPRLANDRRYAEDL